jgi:hypothetical protein
MKKSCLVLLCSFLIACGGDTQTANDSGQSTDEITTDANTSVVDTGQEADLGVNPGDSGSENDQGQKTDLVPETVESGCLNAVDCDENQYCDLMGDCQDQLAKGAPCVTADQCLDGYCVEESCSDQPPEMECSPSKPCPEGQYCELGITPEDAECRDAKATGEECTSNDQCASELCTEGLCAKPPCDTDEDCPSFQHCDDGECKNNVLPGLGCETDDDCGAGNCVNGNCVMILGTPCSDDEDCEDDKYCAESFGPSPISQGNCFPKKELGSSCSTPSACLSGSCEDGVCTSACCNPNDCLTGWDVCDPSTCACVDSATPEDTYYVTTGSVDFDDHISIPVANPVFDLMVCNIHFPPGSPAREEVEDAVYYYNQIHGSAVNMTIVGMDHQSKSDLFPTGLSGIIGDLFNGQKAYLEVVDNAEEGTHQCKAGGETACGDYTNSEGVFVDGWTMNSCKVEKNLWQTKTVRFVVSINPYCYGNDDAVMDPDAGEYPKAHGIAHELGHGFGMNHTNTWPDEFKNLISTMQGGLEPLSAHDARLLTHYHPKDNEPADWVNLAASSVARSYTSTGTFKKKAMTKNPKQLYRDESAQRWYDCATPGESGLFFAAWFNKGSTNTDNKLVQDNKPYLHTFSIQDGADQRVIHAFRGRKMFRYSQDQWFGKIDIHADWLSGLSLNETLSLVFTADVNDNIDELSESDNEWSGTMVLRGSQGDCQ